MSLSVLFLHRTGHFFLSPHYELACRLTHIHTFLPVDIHTQGHQIRIDIASSCFPRYDLNYGVTAEEAATAGSSGASTAPMMRVATNTIYSDHLRPSHISVPMRKVAAVVAQCCPVDLRSRSRSGNSWSVGRVSEARSVLI